ncbi:acyl-CoA dehydrogenase family protein [Mycolicibacterium sp. HK-90]|uniref:acyl-CoA dehydrogenase family protein n=1 Tax=Mycolicibacterium sp. HK-90 TaxID=3056937 RepID=UPI002659AF76|nr:acyl-CoA dehydrogenase family protein [Mycolicibacterium sp. HK-90]WKG04025.1 acyl-CoA dehydrogenase family protein [Mycolicibacterium sp. HK-90]
MELSSSAHAAELVAAVRSFIAGDVMPVEDALHRQLRNAAECGNQAARWQVPDELVELRDKARKQGLWNLFLPAGHEGPYAQRFGTRGGAGLSNVDYAPIAEATGWSFLAPYVFNCNAPDSGNAEVLLRYGSDEQKSRWLDPLLAGDIRSAFAMTEPDVASSDATNMQLTAVIDGGEVVINGRKWWTTGIGHPDCTVLIVMGLTDPEANKYARHSMVLVPRDTPGVKVERMLDTMGFFDEPFGHGEVSFTNVRVPVSNVIAGPGRAFEIAQGRLGPGRVHHAMRMVGLAERALHLACERGMSRTAFGKPIINLGGNRERVADARIAIDSTRLLILDAAWKLDTVGPLGALSEVSAIKVAAPNMAQQVIDFAMQIHGGAGLSSDFPLSAAWTAARAVRLADGPDEVHKNVIARVELGKHGAGR